ncbi:hypothetical protein ASC97_29330 [Rhizobium sp. Root1203]|nr:hypothetical protein ASC97_29330 [Rhizobium sp. Root1203]
MSLDNFRESQERYSTQLTAFAPVWPALDSDPTEPPAKTTWALSQHVVDRDDWHPVDPDKALPWTSKRMPQPGTPHSGANGSMSFHAFRLPDRLTGQEQLPSF